MSEPVALADVPDRLGITYRQADYWARSGLIRSHFVERTSGAHVHPKFAGFNGTGMVRVLDEGEIEVMTLAVDLINAGMNPRAAVDLARRLIAQPIGEVAVGRILLAYRPEQVGV